VGSLSADSATTAWATFAERVERHVDHAEQARAQQRAHCKEHDRLRQPEQVGEHAGGETRGEEGADREDHVTRGGNMPPVTDH
jgi:hypothetical protein